MQLLGARYYLPALGRFLTPDPIGHAGGLNLYAYCDDSPLTRSDPSGKDWASFYGWMSNFSAGAGDHISGFLNSLTPAGPLYDHFGLGSPTQLARRIGGYDGNVDYGSGGYVWGGRAGQAWEVTATSAFGTFAWGSLGGSTMKVMVGNGAPFHVMYQVGDEVLHGAGTAKGAMQVEAMSARVFARWSSRMGFNTFFSFDLPIRNATAAAASGQWAYNCVHAAAGAFLRGWGL